MWMLFPRPFFEPGDHEPLTLEAVGSWQGDADLAFS